MQFKATSKYIAIVASTMTNRNCDCDCDFDSRTDDDSRIPLSLLSRLSCLQSMVTMSWNLLRVAQNLLSQMDIEDSEEEQQEKGDLERRGLLRSVFVRVRHGRCTKKNSRGYPPNLFPKETPQLRSTRRPRHRSIGKGTIDDRQRQINWVNVLYCTVIPTLLLSSTDIYVLRCSALVYLKPSGRPPMSPQSLHGCLIHSRRVIRRDGWWL
jgi:hypothetical protein